MLLFCFFCFLWNAIIRMFFSPQIKLEPENGPFSVHSPFLSWLKPGRWWSDWGLCISDLNMNTELKWFSFVQFISSGKVWPLEWERQHMEFQLSSTLITCEHLCLIWEDGVDFWGAHLCMCVCDRVWQQVPHVPLPKGPLCRWWCWELKPELAEWKFGDAAPFSLSDFWHCGSSFWHGSMVTATPTPLRPDVMCVTSAHVSFSGS